MTTITIVDSLWRHNENCCYANMRSQGQASCLLTLEFKCHLRYCSSQEADVSLSHSAVLHYKYCIILEPMLTSHQRGLVTFIYGQFHRKCSRYYLSLISVTNIVILYWFWHLTKLLQFFRFRSSSLTIVAAVTCKSSMRLSNYDVILHSKTLKSSSLSSIKT